MNEVNEMTNDELVTLEGQVIDELMNGDDPSLARKLRRGVNEIAKLYVGRPNDAIVRQNILDEINDELKELQNKGALSDYQIICDETNNSPASVRRSEVHVRILTKETRAIEEKHLKICLRLCSLDGKDNVL